MENIRSIISIELEIYRAFCITTRSISWNLSCILQTNWPHRQELCQVANWAVVKNLIQLYWVLHIFFPPWIMIIPNIHQYTSIVSSPIYLVYMAFMQQKIDVPYPAQIRPRSVERAAPLRRAEHTPRSATNFSWEYPWLLG